MAHRFRTFKILMWKNWIYFKRNRIRAVCEIVYPLLVCYLIITMKNQFSLTHSGDILYAPFEPSDPPGYAVCDNLRAAKFIAYSPKSPLLKKVLENVCFEATIIEFDTSSLLIHKIETDANFSKLLNLALLFNNEFAGINSTDKYPEHIVVTIRLPSANRSALRLWNTDLLYSNTEKFGPRQPGERHGGEPNYLARGFLHLQMAITFELMDIDSGSSSVFPIWMERFPNLAFNEDRFFLTTKDGVMDSILALLISYVFIYNYINTVKSITLEKEKQLKESMKAMGMPGWQHWITWFLPSFIICLIIILFMLVLCTKYSAVFWYSNTLILFLFFVLYACSIITLAFFVSTLISQANTAAVIACIIYIVMQLPYLIQNRSVKRTPIILRRAVISSLLCNSAFGFAITIVYRLEQKQQGLHWDNFWTPPTEEDTIYFGAFFLMLILDIFLYLLLALYIESLFPGEFGVPQRWYFPCMPSYWCPQTTKKEEERRPSKDQYFEQVTDTLPVGIQFKNLSKNFGRIEAVKNVNLDVTQGQLTVLLGHNGAGKTTTMNLIMGMIRPSNGTVIVNGYDVTKHISLARESMGLCMQHNILFDEMTVSEHIHFFGKLKGLSKREIKKEVDFYLNFLGLQDKRKARISSLAGGTMRQLSIAIALCGNSKVVVLDEPTSGLDPSARRAIWNLLQNQKQGRTIFLTTHFMDEADILGDRVAIMVAGQIQCYGSSFFLKQKFGGGYYLIMDVAPECHPGDVFTLLQKHIPLVEFHSHVASQLTYHLPGTESYKFEYMLVDLERNLQTLKVQSYGFSLTSLEEVFMKVGATTEKKYQRRQSKIEQLSDIVYLTGVPLLKQQFLAMLLKKYISVVRAWILLLMQIVLPIIMLLFALWMSDEKSHVRNFHPLELTLDSYSDPVTLLKTSDNEYADYYRQVLKGHKVVEVMKITAEILKQAALSRSSVREHYIVGASFETDSVEAAFNGDALHSAPLALGLVLSALLLKKTNRTISFTNHPLPIPLDVYVEVFNFNSVGFQIAAHLGSAMAIIAGFYVLFLVRERVGGNKHLQFVSGVNAFIFWGTAFLYDLFTFSLTIFATILTMIFFQIHGFQSSNELGRVILVFLSFAFYFIPLIYVMSYFFSIPSNGFVVMTLFGLITGNLTLLVIKILEMEQLELQHIATPLHWLFLFSPFYSFGRGIADLSVMPDLERICNMYGPSEFACEESPSCCNAGKYFSMEIPGIGSNVLISFLMGITLLILIMLQEYGLFDCNVKCMKNNKSPEQKENEENDVQTETEEIRKSTDEILNDSYVLVLRDLTKYYGDLLAVNGLCLGVKQNECFGLLGPNGAGKTSTFRMMAGDLDISYGDVIIQGISIKTNKKAVQKLIGYCPQFDSLLSEFTSKETIKIMSLIRGLSLNDCDEMVEYLAQKFDMFKHMDKRVKELSTGNRRKLSAALTLIGNPGLIFLDEPTTGMDPVSKRVLWSLFSKLRSEGKCIVFSSYSMEECEAVCTRLVIMVNGSFQCLGSAQGLKNKFAQAYSLIIKVKKGADEKHMAKVEAFVSKNFPGAVLKERFQERLSYELTEIKMAWSKMFGIMERNKEDLYIEEYSLGQCTLEQVLLSFVQEQKH